MERLKKHKKFVQNLLSNNQVNNKKDISKATRGEICTICEIVKNLLQNQQLNVNLNQEEKKLLNEHRKHLEELISRKVTLKRKKRILQKGAGLFLPLIITLMGPILSKLLNKL